MTSAGMPEVFVSYASADAAGVLPLVDGLRGNGVAVWRDGDALLCGEHYPGRIAHAIARCRVVLLVCSPAALASRYVNQEVQLAFDEHRGILPVWLTPRAPLPDGLKVLLAGRQHVEAAGRPVADVVAALRRALAAHGAAGPEVSDPQTLYPSAAPLPVATPLATRAAAPPPGVRPATVVGGTKPPREPFRRPKVRLPWWGWVAACLFAAGGVWAAAAWVFAPDLTARVDDLLDRGETDRALKVCDDEVAAHPAAALPRCERGRVLHAAGKVREALAEEDEALRLDPDLALALARRGQCRWQLDPADAEAARGDCDRAVRLAPESDRVHACKAFLLRATGDAAGATAELNRAIGLNGPRAAAFLTTRGEWAVAADPAAAIADFTEALRRKPNRHAYAGRAEAVCNQVAASDRPGTDELAAAVRDCDAALRIDPQYATAYRVRGECRALAGGHDDEAVSDLTEAVRRDPGSAEAYFTRGTLYARRSRHLEAAFDFRSALECGYPVPDSALKRAEAAYTHLAADARLHGLDAASWESKKAELREKYGGKK